MRAKLSGQVGKAALELSYFIKEDGWDQTGITQ